MLILHMLECGAGYASRRLALAAFDLTVGIVELGAFLGRPFCEKLGVREGAVESPLQL